MYYLCTIYLYLYTLKIETKRIHIVKELNLIYSLTIGVYSLLMGLASNQSNEYAKIQHISSNIST